MRARRIHDPNVYGPGTGDRLRSSASRYGRHSQRLLFVGLLLLFLFGILLSFSRGAWINCAVALMLFCFSPIGTPTVSSEGWQVDCRNRWRGRDRCHARRGVVVQHHLRSFYDRAVIEKEHDVKSGGRFDAQQKALIEIGTHPVGVGPALSREVFGLEPYNMYLQLPWKF
jgi:hypothetical protein